MTVLEAALTFLLTAVAVNGIVVYLGVSLELLVESLKLFTCELLIVFSSRYRRSSFGSFLLRHISQPPSSITTVPNTQPTTMYIIFDDFFVGFDRLPFIVCDVVLELK